MSHFHCIVKHQSIPTNSRTSSPPCLADEQILRPFLVFFQIHPQILFHRCKVYVGVPALTVIRLLHPVSHDDLPDVRGPHAET